MSGPNLIGSNNTNNGFSIAVTAAAAVPAGALILVALATSAPDVTNLTCTDTVGNTYEIQVASQPPGSSTSLFIFYAKNAIAIPIGGVITVTAPLRFSIVGGAMYYTGVQGNFTSSDCEWFTGTACSYTVNVYAGDNLLALMSVNGPTADGFTQATGWGTDLGASVGGNNSYAVHGGAKVAVAAGTETYAPTLGRAKQSVGFLLAFN